jgi:hypothetical protein
MKKELVMLLVLVLVTSCAAITKTPLDIPYTRQKGPSCVPSQVTMALNYYYPERQYTLEQVNSMIGREGEKWTWFSQAVPILLQEGLDAHYFSTTPYYQLTPEFVREYYGPEDGRLINEVTDWPLLLDSIDFLKTSRRYQNIKLDWQAVESAFSRGDVLLMIIDYNTIMGNPGLYSGHGVTITYINQTHVLFHNSAKGPNQKALKQDFIEAWNAPGTDNDVIIIQGKQK